MPNHNNEIFFSFLALKQKKSRMSQSILLLLGMCQRYLKSNSSVGLTAVVRGKLSTCTHHGVAKYGAEELLEPGELGCSCSAAPRGSVPRSGEMEGGRARAACVPSASGLGTCRPIPEVKQDLCTAKQCDT